MRRTALGLLIITLVAGGVVQAGENRTYDTSLGVTWDAAVKAVRDMEFVLVDSDREENTFEMRTKSKWSAKRGYHMQVTLSPVDTDTTTVEIISVDPKKAERVASHIRGYFEALDQRRD